MQVSAIPRETLDGVSNGMAEVQDRSDAGFFFILLNDFCFETTIACNQIGKRLFIDGQDFIQMRFNKTEYSEENLKQVENNEPRSTLKAIKWNRAKTYTLLGNSTNLYRKLWLVTIGKR